MLMQVTQNFLFYFSDLCIPKCLLLLFPCVNRVLLVTLSVQHLTNHNLVTQPCSHLLYSAVAHNINSIPSAQVTHAAVTLGEQSIITAQHSHGPSVKYFAVSLFTHTTATSVCPSIGPLCLYPARRIILAGDRDCTA